MKDRRAGALFWVTAAAGWAIILGVGLRGILGHRIDTRPAQLARFVAGGALIHDVLVAPVVLVAGVLVAKAVRGPARAPVQAAVVVSGIVALYAYPLVRAYGLSTDNPTSLPHNYAWNLALVLAVVWVTAGIFIAVRRRSAGERDL